MLKKISGFLILIGLAINVQAQFAEIEDAMSRGKHKGICIHLDTFNKSVANDVVIKIMGDKDHKVDPTIVSFNELFFDNIKVSSISPGPIDFYAKLKDVDSSIVLFVDFGTTFLGAESHPKESMALQQIGTEIRNKIWEINRKNNIDTIKKRIKAKEAQLERVNDDLKSANNSIKNNTKGAGNNDQTVIEAETKLLDAKAQIKAIDSLYLIKDKEFNAFPLASLKAINQSKNNALDKNRSNRKSMIKSNIRSTEKITEYETEIALNKSSMDVVKDDPKASKKLVKNNQQLNGKISDEKLKIALNDASIKTINTIIAADSIILKINNDSLDKFDENGRRKEMKQMENKRGKLTESTQKHQLDIEKNKQEAIERKKLVEEATKNVEVLKEKQAVLAKELEALVQELAMLEPKK